MEESTFHCWACETRLYTMHEIAQGVCDNCKADINRKNQGHTLHEELILLIRNSLQNPLQNREKSKTSDKQQV